MTTSIEKSILNKIENSNVDTYVIFFTYGCPYSEKALNLLKTKHINFKGYNINEISGGMDTLLQTLNKNVSTLSFDNNHRTKPIVFYNHKFIGGYDELSKII